MKNIPNFLELIKKNWLVTFIFIIIVFLFRGWFTLLPLSTGDWLYNFPQSLSENVLYPYAWINHGNYGMGGNGIFVLPLNTFYNTSNALLFKIGIPWNIIEKIIWFIPFILISVIGSFIFFKRFIVNSASLAAVSSLIFTANTYVFMVAGGGQLAVIISYAFIPLVFYGFLEILEKIDENKTWIKTAFITGIIFSIQLFYDLRIAYVTLLFIFIYYLLIFVTQGIKFLRKTLVPFFVVPGIVTFLLNFFWIVPYAIVGKNPLTELGAQYSTTGIIDFLSFAKFENTISLIHPNWPEDLFGKVYFMRPEFLILPILAFGSLLFVKVGKLGRSIAAFSMIAIVAAFLAKGTNDPAGSFYSWAFNAVPGFQMFRDPTKWYGIIIFAFSILIPFALLSISNLKPKIKPLLNIVIIIFVVFWLVTIRFATLGNLPGTFAPEKAPVQYSKLTKYLDNQRGFFRTLWVPMLHQYSFSTDNHSVIPAGDYLSQYSPKPLARKIDKNLDKLSEASIKYVIIPDDVYGKIFTDDRKYSEKVYQSFLKSTANIKDLKKVVEFNKIVVFQLPDARDLFWSKDKNISLSYKKINPVRYEVDINNAKKGDEVIFSQNYDDLWKVKVGSEQITNNRYKLFDARALNSFVLPKNGSYKIEVYYDAQRWVDIGLIVSGVSAIVILIVLFSKKKK